jgi:uncharacterized membrane protein YphA (DoxX/SURF4 family)
MGTVTSSPGRSGLVSLILRVALGAIFLYAGLLKVTGPRNVWGAAWYQNVSEERALRPAIEKLRKLTLSEGQEETGEEAKDGAEAKQKAKSQPDAKQEGKTGAEAKPEAKQAKQQGKEKQELKERQEALQDAVTKLVLASGRSARAARREDQLHLGIQVAVAWGEVLCGIALLVGFLTRLAAFAMVLIQAGAIYTVTRYQGFEATGGGYEYNIALLTMCLALIISGGGWLSVDWLWARRRQKP